jgi:hypothetical protein
VPSSLGRGRTEITVRFVGVIGMLRQFLVGAAVSACNITIHALVMATVIRVVRIAGGTAMSRQSLRLIVVRMICDSEVGKQCAGFARRRKADILATAKHRKVT